VKRSSVLELAVGGLPGARRGPNGEWWLRHAVRPEGPTPLDTQAVTDFLRYEASWGRTVSVIADDELSDWQTWPKPNGRLSLNGFATQCCSHVFAEGCGSELVCHGTPAATAALILNQGMIRSGAAVAGGAAITLQR
jgi:hypothetical protein